MALPSLTGWKTESVRVTFFGVEPVNAQGKNWWSLATDTTPEHTSSKPNAGEYTEAGPLNESCFLEMKATFNRVDWTLFPIMNADAPPPNLGATEQAFDILIPQVTKWLESSGCQWVRIAYGHTGLYQTDDLHSANAAFIQYLPEFDLNPAKAQDLLLQINYPRISESFDEIYINRICKFLPAVAQFMSFGQTPMPNFKSLTFLRLELDLNTTADRATPIPNDRIQDVLREITVSAKDIFENGMKS